VALAKRELMRLVCGADRRVIADPTGRAPGRGAYVCVRPGCLERALRPGTLARAFRISCVAGADLAKEVRGLWLRESR
jgi:hypothetical protein